ncbi:hypothetical protein [Chryseobacterium sp. Bi04]|uniref:hypothetical protein n=1 Tax=Chryseobacterium sp. Bi04 TaxID=2822345 RepID=UPI001D3C6C49|nr:hypothetical protein [Chryseobacterium sp. Bi04]CAH0255831.1 hypothetical protein SRABI04_03352 [Chryseobacterium sp. Bi04]
MKEFINCYGDENKKKLIEDYLISPVLYLGLLPNQSKNGCCGKLTTNYYIFNAINKKTKEETSFYAGKHCAEEILRLIQKPKLELFNPLSINSSKNQSNKGQSITISDNLDPTNNELINAINIISVAWSSIPPVFTLKIIEYTLSNPRHINYRGVEWVNKSITRDYKNRTLTQIVQDLKDENSDLRNFTFERLKQVMSEKFPKENNRF